VAEIKPAYLIAGSDDAKVNAALARLRERALREGGPGALESFGPIDGAGAPDGDALTHDQLGQHCSRKLRSELRVGTVLARLHAAEQQQLLGDRERIAGTLVDRWQNAVHAHAPGSTSAGARATASTV
jgi:hypothetical protein